MSEEVNRNNLNITEFELKMQQELNKLSQSINDLIVVVPKPEKSIQIIGGTGATSSNKQETVFEIKNPYKQTALIKEIDLSPNANFRNVAILQIKANKETFYDSKVAGFFTNIGADVILLPRGLKLEREEAIQFVFRNTDDTTPMFLAARVQFSI